MKQSFAEERSDCQERMDRRFLKDNIELERQQAVRDILVKRDIARYKMIIQGDFVIIPHFFQVVASSVGGD